MQSRRLKYAKIIGVNLLLLAVFFCLLEGVLRVLSPTEKLFVRTFPGERVNRFSNWTRPDSELGWVANESLFDPTRGGYAGLWTATINKEGFRSKSDFEQIGQKGSAKRIMMLGDSMTFGAYLNDAATLPAFLQERLGTKYEVYNLSSPGWGIDQMYLAYMKYVDTINPDYVIVVFIDDDVWRVFESFRFKEGLNKPSFTVEGGRLKSRREDKPGTLEWIAKRSFIANKYYNGVYKYLECLRIAKALFTELSFQTNRRGESLIVVRYPYKEEMSIGNKKQDFTLDSFFASNGIMFMDPRVDMALAAHKRNGAATFYLDDGHSNLNGNQFIADYILRSNVLK